MEKYFTELSFLEKYIQFLNKLNFWQFIHFDNSLQLFFLIASFFHIAFILYFEVLLNIKSSE